MTNFDNIIKAEFVEKWISVENLKKILKKLDDKDHLFPNRVGNLAVMRCGTYIGFIDIGEEKYEPL